MRSISNTSHFEDYILVIFFLKSSRSTKHVKTSNIMTKFDIMSNFVKLFMLIYLIVVIVYGCCSVPNPISPVVDIK